MSSPSISFVLATLVAFVLTSSASPIEGIVEKDLIVCPEGLIDGVVVYPREHRCTMVGGLCVESDKCRSLVSAKGLCPVNQDRGVECCFELEPQFLPCQQPNSG